MVKVRLTVPRTTASGAQNIGDVVEVSADEAKRMIGNRTAEAVTGPKRKVEKAVKAE